MSYSPTLGRWLEEDPAGYVEGANLYQFEDGNAVTAVDPSGLSSVATSQASNGFTIPEGKAGNGSGSYSVGSGSNGGTLTIHGSNHGAGSYYGEGPQGGIEVSFVPDKGCCKDLHWSQTVKIDILNASTSRPDLGPIINKEIGDHSGNNPFQGPVPDNGLDTSWAAFRYYEQYGYLPQNPFAPPPSGLNSFNPQPPPGSANVADNPYLPSNSWPNGLTVRKTFVLTLYCGDKPLGVTVNWSVTGTTTNKGGSSVTTSVNVNVSAPSVVPVK